MKLYICTGENDGEGPCYRICTEDELYPTGCCRACTGFTQEFDAAQLTRDAQLAIADMAPQTTKAPAETGAEG